MIIFSTCCAADHFLQLENLSFLCSSDNTCPSSMPALIMIDWLIDYDHGHVHDDEIILVVVRNVMLLHRVG